MEIRLDGRSAIVTGGSKGLGLAIAQEYAASGADVAILARDQGALAEAKAQIEAGAPGRKVRRRSAATSSKAADIRRAYDEAMSAFGKIDIFVNNAGQSTRGPSETITDEMWQADFDLKLFAQVRFCRLIFPQMKERRWGRIISVLNIGAKAPGADSAPTSISRAAQMAFTKVLSQEGAPHNVLANSLHVGVIVSDQIVRRHQPRGRQRLARRLHRAGRPRRAAGAHGPRRGIRQHRDLPGVRRRLLRHRHVDQRRWRPLADLVGGQRPGRRSSTPA